MTLADRRDATQKTLDTWRGRTFDWASDTTCAHLARDHLVNMGHNPPEIPEFTTVAGAVRALHDLGWGTMTEALDSMLEPIPPAKMIVGDVAVTPGQDGLESVLILAGPLKLMGWHPETGDFVLYDKGISAVTGAWRA